MPDSMSTGVASRSKVLVTKKLELLVLLNQLEIVEKNVWRVARPLRLKFQSIILNWRKHLGYSALSSATAGFDKETLLKLQELFAELDADGSGYLDAEELGVLFKNMRMPMGQRELDDIVDEIDVDGNGVQQCPAFDDAREPPRVILAASTPSMASTERVARNLKFGNLRKSR